MCEVRSKEKRPRTKKKIQWLAAKRNGLSWTPSGAEWKNARHPVDRTANWSIGGCWFTLALSMWLQTVKFTVKRSKCASLAQEIGFSAQIRAACRGVQHSCAPPKKSVINWTWLQLSIFDWLTIMIRPGGLLLVVTKYAVPVTVLLVGLPKENSLTSTFNFIIQSDKLEWRCS